MKLLKDTSLIQVKALLHKDCLVRIRRPWMTLLQYLWPCSIFLALYILRNRFGAVEINDCQFPARQLPSNGLLPFFQSYICSIENSCTDPRKYEETSDYENAPVTPVLNIIQTIIDEKDIYNAIKQLPIDKNFLSAVTTIATHSKFHVIQENAAILIQRLPEFQKLVGDQFDIKQLFSDDRTFSSSGNILCGKPFPRSNNIRYVEKVLYTEDFNGGDDDEISVMPTRYCKQLYLDVTNSNHGKITWKTIKPIIQGKILYGPKNERNDAIIKYANATFVEMSKLKVVFGSLNTTLALLQTDEEFIQSLNSLVALAKSPIVQAIIGGSVDTELIETILDGVLHDKRVAETVNIIASIFDCFSVDRFIPVNTSKELEDEAYKLGNKKLFQAGIFFNEKLDAGNNISYELRVDVDNTPVTLENKNRFWFPGPEGSFGLDMRYHRGFVQIQQSIDTGIIKYEKKINTPIVEKSTEDTLDGNEDTTPSETDTPDIFFPTDDDDDDENDVGNATETNSSTLTSLFASLGNKIAVSADDLNKHADDGAALEDFLNFEDEADDAGPGKAKNRTRRAPQFDGLLSLFLGEKPKGDDDEEDIDFDVDKLKFYTKQFPYPKYIKDDFKKGLYLAQSVQMGFFVALILHVALSVRQRIWMKESGNSTLMRTMGLSLSSEYISWCLISMIELAVIFFLITCILYVGGILIYSGKLFIYLYLFIFGICLTSFCYMCSTFFSSASIGSVSTVIFFLVTFLPYIIIISLGATLSFCGKFFASLSFSTAFCYAWHYIMRSELQYKELNFISGFSDSVTQNDFKFGVLMMILDTLIYTLIGYFYEKFRYEENKFYEVARQQLDKDTGAVMKNIVKMYVPNKKAVNDVSLTFRKDEVTCLLGRNGAGKSTIIKILTGQVLHTSGEVFLPVNYDLISGLTNDQEKVGLCPQNNILIPNLTAKEHLELYCRIKMKRGFNSEIRRILNSMNLGKYENYRSEELSGGFKRRLCIAIAFLGSPNLVILDEPCSGVDTKARKNIWDLIELLRKGRAVVLATHYLDEAEHLSDNIVILKDGRVVSKTSHSDLKELFTKTFSININFSSPIDSEKSSLLDRIKNVFNEHLPSIDIAKFSEYSLSMTVPYCDAVNKMEQINFEPVIVALQKMKTEKAITSFNVISKNLDELFDTINKPEMNTNGVVININNDALNQPGNHQNIDEKDNLLETIWNLFSKRFLHFKRNYRLLLCIIVLPTIFEIIAMGFMKLRPPGEYEKNLEFTKDLYPGSTDFYAYENETNDSQFNKDVYAEVGDHCEHCFRFDSSKPAADWLLKTNDEYIENRYGGITFNNSKAIVWYNNKGYHSMTTYLSLLSSALLKAELNDSSYNIRTFNHPLKLSESELSESSILQQVADAGIALILLVAFSLVLAGASVFIVNERVNGEKLQQKLCGVKFATYWGVTFFWDLIIYLITIGLAVIVLQIFAIPIYVDREQLLAIVILLLFYGFASIPCVHVFEKLFSDASFANMSIFCLNVIIALSTMTIIIMMDVLGESDEVERMRNFLNRLFLIFPQHGLADGLIEICTNYIKAKIFQRYYINTYKSPLQLLEPHLISLALLGIFFMIVNCLLEFNVFKRLWNMLQHVEHAGNENNNGDVCMNNDKLKVGIKYDVQTNDDILRIIDLSKKYHHNYAVKNVSINVKNGECFGLLGINGAGKSTIFSILSGQSVQTSGHVEFLNKNGISYCPQNNALDLLLTVEEVIKFYGRLRKIKNLASLTNRTLKSFHLEQYRDVLVKNLSGGNRRKLSVACTCFGRTDIVLMDEPTSDMDPLTRSMVYATIDGLIKAKRTVILTSHRISEIEKICNRIAVLNEGKIISTGTPKELNNLFGNSYTITIFTNKGDDKVTVNSIVKDFPSAKCVVRHNHSIKFTLKVKNDDNSIIENSYDYEEHVLLSDVFKKIHSFSKENNVSYTITECQMDQIFENILDKNDNSYLNNAYRHESETNT